MTDGNGHKLQATQTKVADLKPHPRNYRGHPDDQLEHIIASIREHGFYRNIVAAQDGTILAGHGVVAAARKMGLAEVPVIFLDVDPNEARALRLLAGDNEISHLVELDDRMLTGILKELKDTDVNGLLGTGFDEGMLTNLLFVTRPASEIRDKNAAAEWVGMPDYEGNVPLKCVVNFASEADRVAFFELVGVTFTAETNSVWYPPRPRGEISEPAPERIRFEEV